MTYIIAVCTVENPWWWTEELSKSCRVLFQNKFEKLVYPVGFIIRIYQSACSPERQILSLLGFLDCTKMICRLCMELSSSCCICYSYQAHSRRYFQQYLFEYGKLCTKSSRHFSRRIYCLFSHYYQLLFHHQVALETVWSPSSEYIHFQQSMQWSQQSFLNIQVIAKYTVTSYSPYCNHICVQDWVPLQLHYKEGGCDRGELDRPCLGSVYWRGHAMRMQLVVVMTKIIVDNIEWFTIVSLFKNFAVC